MLNTYEVPAMIEDALPELHKALRQFPCIFHLYETMECLRDHTLRQWRDQNLHALERCLRIAGRLYERGNQKVRDAVERILVPGISRAEVNTRLVASGSIHGSRHHCTASLFVNISILQYMHAFNSITAPEAEPPVGFVVRPATLDDAYFSRLIAETIASSAKARGTGIAGRTPDMIRQKILDGKAVIALTPNGEWAGFAYIEAWEGGKFVSNSGLIVRPDLRGNGVAAAIKQAVFRLSRTLYPRPASAPSPPGPLS